MSYLLTKMLIKDSIKKNHKEKLKKTFNPLIATLSLLFIILASHNFYKLTFEFNILFK